MRPVEIPVDSAVVRQLEQKRVDAPQKVIGDGIGIGFHMRHIGKDGRFRIGGVVPGMRVGLFAGKSTTSSFSPLVPDLTLKAGEVKDLGTLRLKAPQAN